MPSFTLRASFLAGGVLVGLAGAVSSEEATAQHNASVPDFYSKGVGWYGVGDFIAVPGGPRPVGSNPAYPYVPNGTGRQPTYRISDVTNPNLKPWVRDFMKKDNDEVLWEDRLYAPRELHAGGRARLYELRRLSAALLRSNADGGMVDSYG